MKTLLISNYITSVTDLSIWTPTAAETKQPAFGVTCLPLL